MAIPLLADELAAPLLVYGSGQPTTAPAATAAPSAPSKPGKAGGGGGGGGDVGGGGKGKVCARVVQIDSPASCGLPATRLLARLCATEGHGWESPFMHAIVYLHGFPDQSLDHRRENTEHYGEFTSRFARKLSEALLTELPDAVFVAFNFSGTPGSDEAVAFAQKTVSREVADARAVLRFLREGGLATAPAAIHIVGLSTGAIIASLLRGCDPHLSITAVAGLVDVRAGLGFDFDAAQLAAFESDGSCLKEFWLPAGSPSNPPHEHGAPAEGADAAPEPGSWGKCWLRLDRQYRDAFLELDVEGAVKAADSSPLLVVHGEADQNVPVAGGKALFEAAAEPKTLLLIPGANHMLTSTKHFQRAAKAIAVHARSAVA